MTPSLATIVRCTAPLALVLIGSARAQLPASNSTPALGDDVEHSLRGGFLWVGDDDKVAIASDNNATHLRPTLFLHGINGHASEFYPLMDWMRTKYGANAPVVHSLAICEGRCSLLTPLPEQRDDMLSYLTSHAASLGIDGEGGFNLVAHSQGALLARSVVQKLPPNLRVQTYVSLAGPQRGQWGVCDLNQSGIAPSVARKMARSVGWVAFYNPVAQRELSVANYWNDPDHAKLFVRESDFLPTVNGYADGGDMAEQRANFLRVGRAVFLGSSGDECINPPLSSVFRFVDGEGRPSPVEESVEYVSDAFGLRTMQEDGRLVLRDCPGNDHMSWLRTSADESRPSLFEQHVLPQLQ